MEENQQPQTGQRSKLWFEKRHKRWTASTNDSLMSEGKAPVSKKAGGDGEMVWKWMDGSKTALFDMFLARLTDTYSTDGFQNAAMERGTDLEPETKERFLELYLSYDFIESEELVPTGFILNPDDDGTCEWMKGYKGENSNGGSSPDGLLYIAKKLTAGFEGKVREIATTNSHAYKTLCYGHKDFWQVHSQLWSLNVKYGYYVHYDDRLPSPWDIKVQLVERSDLHINKLKQKQKDADVIIADWIKYVGDYSTMMPHERDAKILEVRGMCDDLKEMW